MLTSRFADAFAYALALHAGQWRKRSPGEEAPPVPYVAHLLNVAALVLEHGGDEEEAIAALLHDGPEDQGGHATLAQIRRRFGPRVEQIVAGCTDTFESPKPAWLARKRAYLAQLEDGSPSESVLLVALADKVHNARSIRDDRRRLGDEVWRRFAGGRDGTLWYYRALHCVFLRRAPVRARPLADELGRLLAELEAAAPAVVTASPAGR